MVYLKLFAAIALTSSALVQIFNHQTWWFIQNVNLIFHEAGHVLFIFFGNFIATLGGSLLEVLIPLSVVAHFAYKRQTFSAACTCWWISTALLSVSIYASDAQERVLPLITNDISTHDWYNLLTSLNILKYDDFVGDIFLVGSFLSVVLMWYLLSKDKDVAPYIRKFL